MHSQPDGHAGYWVGTGLEQYETMDEDPVTTFAQGVAEQCSKFPISFAACSSVRHSQPSGHWAGGTVAVMATSVRAGATRLAGFW
jgi:hypothetical protein